MSKFYNEVEKICKENKKVAMFIDMDGTIVEYKVFPEGAISTSTKGEFIEAEPVVAVIDNLKKISSINNIDLYILSLSKSNIIEEEKKVWLRNNVSFIDEDKWIIVNKEKGEYNKENRDFIKAEKIIEKSGDYDYLMLLDDDHKILKTTQQMLKDKGCVFHLSSAVI